MSKEQRALQAFLNDVAKAKKRFQMTVFNARKAYFTKGTFAWKGPNEVLVPQRELEKIAFQN
jgi:outer membrane lipoprotein-sorting protein